MALDVSRIVVPLVLAVVVSCQTIEPAVQPEVVDEIIDTKLQLVQSQVNAGFAERALATIRPLARDNPKNKKVLMMTGIVFLALQNPKRAIQILSNAYDLFPDTDVALNYSSALLTVGKLNDARRILAKHLSDKKYLYRERLFHNLGLVYEKANKLKIAKKYYGMALEELPNHYSSLLRLGFVEYRLGEKHVAQGLFERAAGVCKVCFEPLEQLVVIAAQRKDRPEARKILGDYLKRARVTSANRKRAQDLLARLVAEH